MGVSSGLLERLGGSSIAQGVVDFFALFMWLLNTVFGLVGTLMDLISNNGAIFMRLTWVLDLAIAIAVIVYVFMTEVTDIPLTGTFALTEVTARSLVFISGLSLTLVTMSAALGFMFGADGVAGPIAGLELTFSDKYDAYLATFKHGIHTMLAVAISMLWGMHDSRNIRWVDSDVGDDGSILTFLIVIFVALMVSKFLSELKHGEDARLSATSKEVIGSSVSLSEDYKFKHARGSALTIATGLLVYMLVNADLSEGALSFIRSKMVALSLLVYIIVVAIERIAGQREWVLGGAGGLVITGAVSYWNLIAAGMAVGEDKTDEAVVVALGSILLDAMRVGYGQSVSENSVVSDGRKVLLRLLQALAGIAAFVMVTTTETDQHAATSPLLFGVALASALVKIVSITYIGKDMFRSSTEHHFRELASTGLLLSSAYLWSHPLDDSDNSTVAITFFAIGILCRFLDSILDFIMSGKAPLKYISWDKEDEDKGVRSPTSDNPRTWLTLLGLVASLVFAAMAMHEKFDHIELVDGKAANKKLSDSMIVAVTFIAVHVAVVFVGIVSDVWAPAAIGALSRSKFVRFAVTTTVLSSLAVAAGAIGFEGSGVLSSEAVQTDIVSALVAYLFADVVGRELL